MTAQAVTFADFTRGEFGDLGPRLPEGVGQGWFTGKNVIKYRGGLVGPRPGLRALSVTGVPNGFLRLLQPQSGGSAGAPDPASGFAIIGSGAYEIPANGGAVVPYTGVSIGTGSHPPTRTDFLVGSFLSVRGVGSYRTDSNAHTIAAEAGIPACSILFGRLGRILAANTADNPSRLWYSEPGALGWTTFNDFYDIADALGITGLHELRNGLLIAKFASNSAFLTGTIGTSSAVLREVSRHGCPGNQGRGLSLDTDAVVFIARGRDYPQLYNGAVYEDLRHLKFAGLGAVTSDEDNSALPSYQFVKLPQVGDWLVTSGLGGTAANKALMAFDGARTFHEWEVDLDAMFIDLGNDRFMAAGGGTATTPSVFYSWKSDLNRPAFTSDADVQPGDASTTPFDAYMHLPAWLAPDGQEVLVRGVIIEFRKWSTGSGATNHFEVTATAMRRYSAANPVVSSAQTFDEAGALASTDGIDARVHMQFGDQGYGGEAQIKIDAIRGVGIRSVTMILEVRPERP